MTGDDAAAMSEDSKATVGGQYCGRCGGPATSGDHGGCVDALSLEPPRYCPACRRRMTVQVVPSGWTARCVEHGELTGSTWPGS